MEDLTTNLIPTSDMPEDLQEQARRVDAVMEGVDELAAYAGKRPSIA